MTFSNGSLQRSRRHVPRLLAVLVFLCSAALKGIEDGALPLPRWTEQELKAFKEGPRGLGAILPESDGPATDIGELLRTPVPSGPRLEHSFGAEGGALSPRLRPEDMGLFLPASILGPSTSSPANVHTQRALPTPVVALRQVSAEFLTACERISRTDYLLDPDLLVPEMQHHDLQRFLEFHAKDARISLYIVILDRNRKLPETADWAKIISGDLRNEDTCLLVYPLGEPWRSRLFVSRAIHDQTSPAFLVETIQACLTEAMQASDAHDQLHRYAVHLSTRLFWLQKALGLGHSEAAQSSNLPLTEVTPEMQLQTRDFGMGLVPWGLGFLIVCVVSTWGIRRLGHNWRLRCQSRIWILPEPETIPRLGGAFSGGGGAMTRYT